MNFTIILLNLYHLIGPQWRRPWSPSLSLGPFAADHVPYLIHAFQLCIQCLRLKYGTDQLKVESLSMGNSSSAALPYVISPEALTPSTKASSHGWAIHSATRKSDGGPFTAFQASKADLAKTPIHKNRNNRYGDPSQTQLIPALHHFHRIKRLIHPRILRAHATLDTDYPSSATSSEPTASGGSSSSHAAPGLDALHKTVTTGTLIIVTEKATPLDDWLESLNPHTLQANAAAVSWGIHNIVEALSFLHTQAKVREIIDCFTTNSIIFSGENSVFFRCNVSWPME